MLDIGLLLCFWSLLIMNQVDNCLICKSKISLSKTLAIPQDLCIEASKNFEIIICAICLHIKNTLDNHISLTTGEAHLINGKQEFIKLNEYWSDWAIDFKPLDSSELTKLNSFKNWNSFSFASHQLNFNSKKEALNTILDYRNEYKKNFHIVSFKSYAEILKNITRALLSQTLPAGVLKLTSVNDPIYGDTKLLEWSGYQHVQLFLEKVNNYY